MTHNTCPRPHCGRPIPDGAYICPDCATHLATELRDAANLWKHLEETVGRQSRTTSAPSTGPRRLTLNGPTCASCDHTSCHDVWKSQQRARTEPPLAHEEPPLINLAASEDAWIITNTATSWAGHISVQRGMPVPERRHIAREAIVLTFIATHIDWLAHRPEAPDAFDELHSAINLIRHNIDTNAGLLYLGPCDTCHRDLYTREGTTTATCPGCATTYDVTDRRDWLLQQADDRLERAADICRALSGFGIDITRHRLKQWEYAGLLIAKGHDHLNRPLYRVGDVVDVSRRMLEKRASHAS